MDILIDLATSFVAQLQQPTLAFLIGGMALAALGSRLEVPEPVYKFMVLVLLLKVGMSAGVAVREAELAALAAPAIGAALLGVAIVLVGGRLLAAWPGVSKVDAMATAGLFGAVSASTLAAGMAVLDDAGVAYEGFIGALYPFMDVAALVTAVVLARLSRARQTASGAATGAAMLGAGGAAALRPAPLGAPDLQSGVVGEILRDTLKSPAISALLLGLALGALARPESVLESFYEPLFRGLLSLLMLVMGMEAWSRLAELRKVAHAYALYATLAPIAHGLCGLALGLALHELTGFSAGGAVLLAVMAASSSDISGPPTLRGALPEANASAYVGASTGIGTPVAILSIPLFMALADSAIGF